MLSAKRMQVTDISFPCPHFSITPPNLPIFFTSPPLTRRRRNPSPTFVICLRAFWQSMKDRQSLVDSYTRAHTKTTISPPSCVKRVSNLPITVSNYAKTTPSPHVAPHSLLLISLLTCIPKQIVARGISSPGHDLMATWFYCWADESTTELQARPCARAPESA